MYCTHCGKQIDEGSRFCSFCGTPVQASGSVQPLPQVTQAMESSHVVSKTALESSPGWSRRKRTVAAVVIVIVVLVLIVLPSLDYFLPLFKASGITPPLPRRAAPYYDLQIGEAFAGDYSSLAWNVTAVEQNDTFGYGPSYLLNGVSDTGYWYQVGIAWNWSGDVNKTADTAVIYQGFHMVYQVYYPNGTSDTIGLISLSGNVKNGNSVLLGIRFSAGDFILSVHDWNTGAEADKTVSGYGATLLSGGIQKAGQGAFFTGLMTEWYRVDMNDFAMSRVTYTVDGPSISSVVVFMDEWNFSGDSPVSVFHYSTGWVSVSSSLSQFTYNGVTALASSSRFVTY